MYIEIHFELVNRAVCKCLPVRCYSDPKEPRWQWSAMTTRSISAKSPSCVTRETPSKSRGIKVREKVALNLSSQVGDGEKVTANEVEKQSSATQGATTAAAAGHG